MNTTYITPIAVPRPRSRYGHTACSTGVTIANAHAVSTACGMPQITNHVTLCVENCSGVKSADGRISSADEHERLGRVLAVRAVEVARRPDRGTAPRCHPARLRMKPRCRMFVHVQRVVQVEHLQAAEREQAEAERGERDDRRADRRDLLEPRRTRPPSTACAGSRPR